MATRGSLVVSGRRYLIGSDAYPSYAREVIREVLRTKPKTRKELLRRLKKAGLDLQGKASKNFGYPFEEYRYAVNLRRRTVKTIVPRRRKRKKRR